MGEYQLDGNDCLDVVGKKDGKALGLPGRAVLPFRCTARCTVRSAFLSIYFSIWSKRPLSVFVPIGTPRFAGLTPVYRDGSELLLPTPSADAVFRDAPSLRGLFPPVGIQPAAFAVETVGSVVYRADAQCRMAATRTPQRVEQTFVMPEKKKVDTADGNCSKSDARVFACDYDQQATDQRDEED